MKRSDYLRALECVNEIDAMYGASVESMQAQGRPTDEQESKDFDNHINGAMGIQDRLAHVRAVLEHSMARTGGRWATRSG